MARNRSVELLGCIVSMTERDGMPPTIAELAIGMGCSQSGIQYMLRRLRADGLVMPGHSLRRAIRLSDAGAARLRDANRGGE